MYLHTPVLEVGSWWRVDTASGTNTPTTVYAHDGADAIPTALGVSGSTVRGNTRDGTGLFWSSAATLYCKELTYQGVPTGTVVTSTGVTPTTPSGAPVDIATISAAVAALPTTYVHLLTTDAASTSASGTLAAWHLTPVDATSAPATWTLPAANSVAVGVETAVKKADTSANTVTASRAGSDLIFGTGSGSTSKVLTLAGEAITFVSNGVDRWTVQTSDTPSGVLASTYLTQASATSTYARTKVARLSAALAVDTSHLAVVPLMDQSLVPTVAFSAAGASSVITSGVETLASGGPFTLSGGTVYNTSYSGVAGYVGPSGPPGPEATPMFFSFDTDAADFEVTYLGSATPKHRLVIDGEARDSTYQSATGGSGQQHRMRVTFAAGRKWRRITVDSASMGIKSVVVGPTDTLQPPGIIKPKLAIIGDSYTVNNNGELGFTACRALGMSAMLNGSGGTGFLNASSGGKQAFGDRVATVLAGDPDGLVVYGGVNDNTSGLQAAVTALVTAARATSQNLPVVIVGSQSPPAQASGAAARSAALKAGAAAARAAYADPVTGHVYNADGTQVVVGTAWITGTGYSGATTGSGNGDIWIDTDGTHPLTSTTPTASGYVYHGLRLAAALRAALPVAI